MPFNNVKYYILSFFLGYVLSFSFTPHDIWIAQIISTGGFFLVLGNITSSKSSFLTSFLYLMGVYFGSTQWVSEFNSFESSVEMKLMIVFAFVLYCSFIFALVMSIYHYYFRINRFKYFYFSFAWFIFELLRANLFGGNPCLNLGSTHVDTFLKNYMPIVGTYGVTFICILLSVLLADLYKNKLNFIGIILIILSSFILGMISWVETIKEDVTVTLVQPNLSDEEKWDTEIIMSSLEKYKNIAQNTTTDLTILPETAFALSLDQIYSEVSEINEIMKNKSKTMIAGITVLDSGVGEKREEFSSAIALGMGEGINHKKHMIPFYEYIPIYPEIKGLLDINRDYGLISYEGEQDNIQLIIDNDKYNIATTICYEIFYANTISKKAINSNLIVLISNTASFGKGFVQTQQFRVAQVRALENQKYTIVNSNTGVTGIIDNNGQIIKTLPVWTEGMLMGKVNMLQGETLFNKVGNSIIWCLMLFIVFFHLMLFLYKNRFFKNKSD